jgi:hypothetical protein
MARIRAAMILAWAVALACGGVASAQRLLNAPRVSSSGSVYHIATCPGPVPAGMARCFAHIVTDRSGNLLVNRFVPNRLERTARAAIVPSGYGPMSLNLRYNPAVVPSYPVGVGSSTTTIAIVDAFGYSNAEADLQVYRNEFHLPTCTTANGCFAKYNESGVQGSYPADNLGWA